MPRSAGDWSGKVRHAALAQVVRAPSWYDGGRPFESVMWLGKAKRRLRVTSMQRTRVWVRIPPATPNVVAVAQWQSATNTFSRLDLAFLSEM